MPSGAAENDCSETPKTQQQDGDVEAQLPPRRAKAAMKHHMSGALPTLRCQIPLRSTFAAGRDPSLTYPPSAD